MKPIRPSYIFAPLLALVLAAVGSAARLEAPSKYVKQDRYRSAVVKIAQVTEDGSFRLEVLEQLFGETPDGLVVRPIGEVGVELGRTYVIGHTDKPARRSPRYDTDPAGSRILGVPAVGPAVFENSEAMRSLVRDYPEDAPLTDRKRLDAVLEQLGSADVQSRRFVLAELVLEDELRALVDDADLEVLRSTLRSGELEPMAHDYLLRAARPMIEEWGTEWLLEDCRRIVASQGADLDLASLIPSLLVTALETLGEVGEASDAQLARAHVASNNPGVGRAAFEAIVALDPKLATEVAASYADSPILHPDTRRRVQQFVAQAAQGPDAGTP